MRSQLYECRITHERFEPARKRFTHPIFFFSIELEELAELDSQLRLFSFNRGNLYSFRDRDFFPTDAAGVRCLRERLLDWMHERGVDKNTIARIQLITLPRVAGYLFNPVSFYFCFDRAGLPIAAIAEVTNTFHEVKPFLVGPTARGSHRFRLRTPKDFYVSPYSDLDVSFDFDLRAPNEKLGVRIDDYDAGRRTLTSVLSGKARPLTDGTLAWFTLKYPLVTLRTICLIHWHAFRLYLQSTPWFAKAARPERQRDLYRPHRSIRPQAGVPPAPECLAHPNSHDS